MTKKHAALLTVAAFIAFASAESKASTPGSTAAGAKNSEPPTQAQTLRTAPTAASTENSPKKNHTFRVTDKKGVLLTCIAPQIDTDADTDLFEDCALAPSRTLDDVMHTFVGAIHYEQNEHAQERAEWIKDLKEKSNQKAAQK
jgi:hypothetical protein